MTNEAEIQRILRENTVLFGTALVAVGMLILTQPTGKRPDVPGLGGRRNAAWRGKGSFGKAPFGSQVSHRRG